jgi:hypothetical protein
MTPTERKKKILIRSIEREIPLAAIARAAGTSRQHVYLVARGDRASRRVRRLICERLGFRPKELGWPPFDEQRAA